jgi:sugar phosphate isomerase/epimerase
MERLAVCSWSLQPPNARQLVAAIRETGLSRIQCALDPFRLDPDSWDSLPQICAEEGLSLVSGMFGAEGEDYSTLDSIRITGGLVPEHTWNTNWRNIQATVVLAKKLGLKLVTFHAGFLPHNQADPAVAKLVTRIRQVADLFADQGLDLAMETGQETAGVLKEFLQHLDRANVGVNFDPANMILYDQGDPIQAMRVLGPWIRQCHIKDARRTRTPGTWGDEVPVGTGEVDWRAFLSTLRELGFAGDLVIEREAGSQRVQDIRAARRHLETLAQELA